MVKQIRPKLEAAYSLAYSGKDTALSAALNLALDAFNLGEPELQIWRSGETKLPENADADNGKASAEGAVLVTGTGERYTFHEGGWVKEI